MLTWDELKQNREIINSIDWEVTPREMFEAYQLKSPGNWKYRSLPEVCYFYLSSWRGENKVILMKRGYVHSEEIAEAPAPPELVAAAVAKFEGEDLPRGQLPLDEPLRTWLQKELGV
ncbi:MAG: hypothetical protein KQJ78_20775 [Deltaproteobacteria bacterium]|nr:hypothetical protein [Deltaproteobacteria bacterium]